MCEPVGLCIYTCYLCLFLGFFFLSVCFVLFQRISFCFTLLYFILLSFFRILFIYFLMRGRKKVYPHRRLGEEEFRGVEGGET